MAVMDIRPFLNMVPALQDSPERAVWMTYDSEADALYIHYKQPNLATDTELTDDDVILRYRGDELIGMTVLHASRR